MRNERRSKTIRALADQIETMQRIVEHRRARRGSNGSGYSEIGSNGQVSEMVTTLVWDLNRGGGAR